MFITVPTLTQGLQEIGLEAHQTVLVHCSMASFGRIHGGAESLLVALQSVLAQGTLVMPSFSRGRFDPKEWGNPPLDPALWDRARYEVPPYDPDRTPVDWDMSQVYELFRNWPDVRRSPHAHSSFAAWGREARSLVATHALDDRFGESSPLARLYDLNARVLFLGTGYDTNTCFHLAEYRQTKVPRRKFWTPVADSGEAGLFEYEDVETNSSVFAQLGRDFELAAARPDTGLRIHHARIGAADCAVFSLVDAVDFATNWLG